MRQNIMCFAITAQDVRGACEALTVGVISEGSLQVYGSWHPSSAVGELVIKTLQGAGQPGEALNGRPRASLSRR